MKIAIVHDHLAQTGGAERVVAALHGIWPDAPIFTAVYVADATHSVFRKADVRTSFLQRIAHNTRLFRLAMPLYPFAFEQFDLTGYDVVLSTSAGFAHGAVTQPHTCHVCYCHTPARFAWRFHDFVAGSGMGTLARTLLAMTNHGLRVWDYCAAQRVDEYIANSHNVARRIGKFYGRPSQVIHPPVETDRFYIDPDATKVYFLVVSRLIGYKRIDLAVQACTKIGVPLKVVGTGPDRARLQAMAGPTVEFLGRLTDAEIRPLLANCRAFLFPGEEDFGIAPLEAMASGRPVIALRAGGALETVVEGVTGEFFDEAQPQSLANIILGFDPDRYESATIRAHSETFGLEHFQRRIRSFVEQAHARNRAGGAVFKGIGAPSMAAIHLSPGPVNASVEMIGLKHDENAESIGRTRSL